MNAFPYRDGELHCDGVPAARLAEHFGTPLYVYSKAALLHGLNDIRQAFEPVNPTICYSIKSCSNIHICRILADAGSGFDVTSGGELYRALQAGGDPKKIIFAGVGKTDEEIRRALEANIAAFNLESEEEIENVNRIASDLNKPAVGALRVNPHVEPKTHAKTTTGRRETKFGIDIDRAEQVFQTYRSLPNLRITGVHIHIGSPVYAVEPYVEAVRKTTALIDRLAKIGQAIEWFDLGGGFAANYAGPEPQPPISELAAALLPMLVGKPYRIVIEPGRYIAGNAGILLTRVLYRKQAGSKTFIIVDAAMNDLVRPTLYDAYHHIWPVRATAENAPQNWSRSFHAKDGETVDIVGPVCEAGDYFAQHRRIPRVQRGELLAIFTAGAYGFSMSSNYNNRPRAAEVLVHGGQYQLIRRRETVEDLVAPERI